MASFNNLKIYKDFCFLMSVLRNLCMKLPKCERYLYGDEIIKHSMKLKYGLYLTNKEKTEKRLTYLAEVEDEFTYLSIVFDTMQQFKMFNKKEFYRLIEVRKGFTNIEEQIGKWKKYLEHITYNNTAGD